MNYELVFKKPSELQKYAKNSRTHTEEQIKQVMASIEEFGFTNPILIHGKTILAGHCRLEAAKRLGFTEVPTIALDSLTKEQARAYVIADNKLALNAGWDDSILREEIEALMSADYAIELLGFTDEELADLGVGAEEPEPSDKDPDEVPDVPQNIHGVKRGDVWQLGNHRLMCGDSTSKEDVDKLMQGEKADMVFTSPPYNLGSSVAMRNGARSKKDSAYNNSSDNNEEEWDCLMTNAIENALNHSGFTCINVQMLAGNKKTLMKLFAQYNDHLIDLAIWEKTNPPPAMATGVFTSAFEFLWFLSANKNPKRTIPKSNFRGTIANIFKSATASGHDASVHGAVFPVSLAIDVISIADTATILDLFGGLGTTLIACEKTGRHCRMMELDEHYCSVIIERWQQFTNQKAKKIGGNP